MKKLSFVVMSALALSVFTMSFSSQKEKLIVRVLKPKNSLTFVPQKKVISDKQLLLLSARYPKVLDDKSYALAHEILEQRKEKIRLLQGIEQEIKEEKEKKQKFSTLSLEQVTRFIKRLPGDCVAHIGSFIPYYFRMATIENPIGNFKKLNPYEKGITLSDNKALYSFDHTGRLKNYIPVKLRYNQADLRFDRTGRQLAAITDDDAIFCLDQKEHSSRLHQVKALWCNFNPQNSQEVLYQDKKSHYIKALNTATGVVSNFIQPRDQANRYSQISPDNKHLLLYGGSSPEVWNIDNATMVGQIEIDQESEISLRYNYNGSQITASSPYGHGCCKVFDGLSGRCIFSDHKVRAASMNSIEGTHAFIVLNSKGRHVLDLNDIKKEQKSLPNSKRYNSAISPNGKIMAYTDVNSNSIYFCDTITGTDRGSIPFEDIENYTLSFGSNSDLLVEGVGELHIIKESVVKELLVEQQVNEEKKSSPREEKKLDCAPYTITRKERSLLAQDIQAFLSQKVFINSTPLWMYLPCEDREKIKRHLEALKSYSHDLSGNDFPLISSEEAWHIKMVYGNLLLKANKYKNITENLRTMHRDSEIQNNFMTGAYVLELVHTYNKKYQDFSLLKKVAYLEIQLQALLPVFSHKELIHDFLKYIRENTLTKEKISSIQETVNGFQQRTLVLQGIMGKLPYISSEHRVKIIQRINKLLEEQRDDSVIISSIKTEFNL